MKARMQFANLHHKINIKQHLAQEGLTKLAALEPPTAISLCVTKLMRDASTCVVSPLKLELRKLVDFKKHKFPLVSAGESSFNQALKKEIDLYHKALKRFPKGMGVILFREQQIRELRTTMLLLNIKEKYRHD